MTKKLDLKPYKTSTLRNKDSSVSNFDNHISINKKIQQYLSDINYGDFNFTEISLDDVIKKC